MIITIDGPSGTGKSTVAQEVAKRLGITYFDTGAMYRAITWLFLQNKVDLNDSDQVAACVESFSFSIRKIEGEDHYFANDTDVTDAIRTQEITNAVSPVSALEVVRKKIWAIQRKGVEKQSAVFEGRDMGSVVFPNAELKIFLDASPKVRAKRRLAQMRKHWPIDAKGFDQESMEKELKRRDRYDSSRELAPLTCPKGATRIDTSKMTIEQVVDKIVALEKQRVKHLAPGWRYSKNMRFLYRAVLWLAWTFVRICYRHKIYGLEHFIKRAAIIAPNHTSFWDPPLVSVSWPEEVHFLARESLFRNRLFGSLIRKLNAHPVSGDVGDVSVFKTILELLKGGKQLILFPEGGRTDGELGPIKPGIGMLALRSHAAIVPTYIHGASTVWGRKRKLPKLFGKTAVVFGSAIDTESFANLEKKEAQAAIASTLSQAILKLKDWYDSGCQGTPP